jgi:bacterial/archaeal transporter family-2 protein
MLIYLVPVILGLSVSLQSTANGLLSSRIGLPMTLLLTSSVVWTCSAMWWCVERYAGGAASMPFRGPWQHYTGGVLGVVMLSCGALAFPRLGATTTTVLAVSSQALAALLLDHSGVLGERMALSPLRIAGVVLVAIGAALVLGFGSKAGAG